MGKPNKLTYMVPGKSIGATVHKGLADTFNWIVNFCNNLRGDDASITIDNELGDWPTIRATSMGVEESESECDCELTPILTEGTKIAEWTKNGVTTDIYAPEAESESECDCELTPCLEEGTKIAEWTKNGVTTDIYAPEGGECTCEMEATTPQYDKNGEGHSQQYWKNAEVGKFTDCGGNETTLYAPNHVQFKCNVYPYWSNMGNVFELASATDSNIRITPDGTKLTIGCYYI